MGAAATQSITESQNHRGYRSLSLNHKPCSSCFREIRKMRFNKDIFNYIQHIFYNTTTTKTNTGLVSLFLQKQPWSMEARPPLDPWRSAVLSGTEMLAADPFLAWSLCGQASADQTLLPRHIPLLLDWTEIWGNLEVKSTHQTHCCAFLLFPHSWIFSFFFGHEAGCIILLEEAAVIRWSYHSVVLSGCLSACWTFCRAFLLIINPEKKKSHISNTHPI